MRLSKILLIRVVIPLLGTVVMATPSHDQHNKNGTGNLSITPVGVSHYDNILGDKKNYQYQFTITNNLPASVAQGLLLDSWKFTLGTLSNIVLKSTDCPFGSPSKYLKPAGQPGDACTVTFQATAPSKQGTFSTSFSVADGLGGNSTSTHMSITVYPKDVLGEFLLRQGTTSLKQVNVTAGKMGTLTLYNLGTQPVESYQLHIPTAFSSDFSGDCRTLRRLPGKGTCTLNYFIPLSSKPAEFTIEATSTTAYNSPYTIPVIIGKGRPLLVYSHHAIAVGLGNAEKWGLFPSTTLGLAPGDALTQLALNHNTIIAGTEKGLVTSQDNGKTWHYQHGMAGYSPYPKATQIVALDDVWAVGTPGGLSVTLDKGANWHTYTNQTPGFSLNPAITALALSPHQIAVGTLDGVSFSTDQGTTWHTATNTTAGFSPSNHVTAIATQANTLWVGTQNGLSMTTDGTYWQTFDDDTPGFSAYPDVTALSLNQGEVCALTLWGLSVSDDDGQHWRTYDDSAMGLASNTHLQAVNCQASLFAVATMNNALAISTDKGAHWHTALPDTTPGYSTSLTLNQLAIDGSLTTIAVATGKGVSISYDGGATWQTLTPMTPGFLPEDNSLGLVIPLIGETTLLNALMQNATEKERA